MERKNHPYARFEGTPTWKKVNRAISALVKNGDLHEATGRSYIVGYICKTIGTDLVPNTKQRRVTRSK